MWGGVVQLNLDCRVEFGSHFLDLRDNRHVDVLVTDFHDESSHDGWIDLQPSATSRLVWEPSFSRTHAAK